MRSLPVIAGAVPARSYERETQAFSTWGGKLLQHADVLARIQRERRFQPITVQLAPTEACDSNCPFCSVGNRPVNRRIPWTALERGLGAFRELGAKSVEITGGGNPLLYRDGGRDVNDVVALARDLGFAIGIITNSEDLSRHLDPELAPAIAWIRVSLIKLDEGKAPEDYRFDGFPLERIGFSYIVYDGAGGRPGTTSASIEKIARLVELHPAIKFVRIASDCLTEQSLTIKRDWGDVVAALDRHHKFFIKEINDSFRPHDGGCWVGMLRPYWVHDGVYICTSHVLKHRTYHTTWKLCGHDEIAAAWERMNARFRAGQPPYDIDVEGECFHCYYRNNNALLANVINPLPDPDFA